MFLLYGENMYLNLSNNFIIYRSFIVFIIHKKYTQQPLKKHNLIFIVSVQWVVNLGSSHGLLNIDTIKITLKLVSPLAPL